MDEAKYGAHEKEINAEGKKRQENYNYTVRKETRNIDTERDE